jgi:hypothetical protein
MSSSLLAPCPKDHLFMSNILYHNGFGLEAPGITFEDFYSICMFLSDDHRGSVTTQKIDHIKNITKSNTLELRDFCGIIHLVIHWTEHHLIEHVITELLKSSIKFSLSIKCKPSFDTDVTIPLFKWETLETKLIETWSDKTHIAMIKGMCAPSALFDVWNWKTEQGKEFCHKIRKMVYRFPIEQDEATDSFNYYNWREFKNHSTTRDAVTLEYFQVKDSIKCWNCMENIERGEEEIDTPNEPTFCGVECDMRYTKMNSESTNHK